MRKDFEHRYRWMVTEVMISIGLLHELYYMKYRFGQNKLPFWCGPAENAPPCVASLTPARASETRREVLFRRGS